MTELETQLSEANKEIERLKNNCSTILAVSDKKSIDLDKAREEIMRLNRVSSHLRKDNDYPKKYRELHLKFYTLTESMASLTEQHEKAVEEAKKWMLTAESAITHFNRALECLKDYAASHSVGEKARECLKELGVLSNPEGVKDE